MLKTRTQPKSYQQNSKNPTLSNRHSVNHSIDEQTNLRNRSKSELDLSVKPAPSLTAKNHHIDSSKENIAYSSSTASSSSSHASNPTCPLSKNTGSMFGFFSRKKNSDTLKSRTSLNTAQSDSVDLKVQEKKDHRSATSKKLTDNRKNEGISEVDRQIPSPAIKTHTKKRPAPAPPVQAQINAVTPILG